MSTARTPTPPTSPTPSGLTGLLAGLPTGELARVRPALERVRLELHQVLYQPGERIAHVYFPIDSLISLLTVLKDGGAIETGLVGPEGMAGLPVFLRKPLADRRAVCQQAGDAWRLPTGAFLDEVKRGGALAERLLPYTAGVLRVATQLAACNRVHPVEERSARWLLTVADRVGRDTGGGKKLAMTQQFMSEMLGVRRSSVVVVLGALVRAGLIENAYGTVTIVDRARLEAVACECYGALNGVYRRAPRRGARGS